MQNWNPQWMRLKNWCLKTNSWSLNFSESSQDRQVLGTLRLLSQMSSALTTHQIKWSLVLIKKKSDYMLWVLNIMKSNDKAQCCPIMKDLLLRRSCLDKKHLPQDMIMSLNLTTRLILEMMPWQEKSHERMRSFDLMIGNHTWILLLILDQNLCLLKVSDRHNTQNHLNQKLQVQINCGKQGNRF